MSWQQLVALVTLIGTGNVVLMAYDGEYKAAAFALVFTFVACVLAAGCAPRSKPEAEEGKSDD